MPYIITTREAAEPPNQDHAVRAAVLTERAVATLDEARGKAGAVVNDLADPIERVRPFYDTIAALPESGGTIGPLPDGTVIEVQRVDREWIGDRLPIEFFDACDGWPATDQAILDAFNAR